jgi:hypothetical protein
MQLFADWVCFDEHGRSGRLLPLPAPTGELLDVLGLCSAGLSPGSDVKKHSPRPASSAERNAKPDMRGESHDVLMHQHSTE